MFLDVFAAPLVIVFFWDNVSVKAVPSGILGCYLCNMTLSSCKKRNAEHNSHRLNTLFCHPFRTEAYNL